MCHSLSPAHTVKSWAILSHRLDSVYYAATDNPNNHTARKWWKWDSKPGPKPGLVVQSPLSFHRPPPPGLTAATDVQGRT